MLPKLDIDEISRNNPAVDAGQLEQLREIQKVLERAGIARKADYRLEPPLGGAPSKRALSTGGSIRLI